MTEWFRLHGSDSVDAAHKALGAIYGMVQQQAMMLSFVEAFWIMGVIFLGMIPLLLLLRNARDLHPHTPKATRQTAKPELHEPQPELAGMMH